MDVQEIKRAVQIHDYIDNLEDFTNKPLKTSPIILGLPTQKIIFNIPEYTSNSYEYVEQLYEDIGDHDLLFKAMRTGWSYISSSCKIMPTSKKECFQQLMNSHAFRIAKARGYLVPDSCLREKQVYYGEYEAYYAVSEILEGNALGVWSRKSGFDNFMYNYAQWHKSVKFITSQFIVPSSGQKNKIPHIIDQLWLIANDKNQVRLLGLEIGGEQQFLDGSKSKTLGKENYLKELGYEMYYVASWWCRVDPYRVICEFLNVSGIFPDAIRYLIGSELNSIDEYICGICHTPMVRWNWDWIQKCQIGNSTVLAHKSCVNHRKNNGY